VVSRPELLAAPVLLPLLGAIAAAFAPARAAAWVAVGSCGAALAASATVLGAAIAGGPQVYRIGGWPAPFGIPLVADLLGAGMATLAALLALCAALHTMLAGGELRSRKLYHPLFLLLVMALMGAFLTGDLFNLYVFMELVILSSFALVAMAERPVSAEATFKYAVLSALGSTVLLIAVALLYAALGTLNLADVARRNAAGVDDPILPVAVGLMLFVFLLKAAVFPFHFWQPDAHSAAPAPISAMLSGMLVKVGIYGIIRMQTLLFPGEPVYALLGPLGAVSAVFGGLAALASRDLKRLLAYSTISNMGFLLAALGWGGGPGLVAALVNVVTHALIKAGLFLSGGYIAERFEEHDMRRMGGVAGLSPLAAGVFGVGAVALAGLPPTGALVSKLTLLQAGVAAGSTWVLGGVLLASLLGIAYPLRAFVLVCWGDVGPGAVERWQERADGRGALLAPVLLGLVYLGMGLWPGPLMTLVSLTVAELGDPAPYIHATLGGGR
jgi:multicomponent Na+:H+ antiporter subunit D